MVEFVDPGSVPPVRLYQYDSNGELKPFIKPAEAETEADLDANDEATTELEVVEFYPVSIIVSGTFAGGLHVQVRKGSDGEWRYIGTVLTDNCEWGYTPKFRDCRIRVIAQNWRNGTAHVEVRQG